MARVASEVVREIEQVARPWEDAPDMDALMERVGEARYVLLGEASHGTSEFYAWRAQISKRLITEKGFSFIAVEGDWPDCYRVNRYVKGYPEADNAAEALAAFSRWPTWMWANREMIPLVEWMRRHNAGLDADQRVGFYGLDVYSLWESIQVVIQYLDEVDPEAAREARRAYLCFEPYGEDPQRYAFGAMFAPKSCEDEVIQVLQRLREDIAAYPDDPEEVMNLEQNARIVVNAERYYRTMIRANAASWNIRDRHMTETLNHLTQRYGSEARAIVWAHNTHVGDARYTDMAGAGMVNIGQLVREAETEDKTVLVGFASHRGTVIAGSNWDAPMQVMEVPPARANSWDGLMHEAGPRNKLVLSVEADAHEALGEVRGQRAIGVVYDPARDHYGNYVDTLLRRRYDALIYLDETHALRPLQLREHPDPDLPETYPWAV